MGTIDNCVAIKPKTGDQAIEMEREIIQQKVTEEIKCNADPSKFDKKSEIYLSTTNEEDSDTAEEIVVNAHQNDEALENTSKNIENAASTLVEVASTLIDVVDILQGISTTVENVDSSDEGFDETNLEVSENGKRGSHSN